MARAVDGFTEGQHVRMHWSRDGLFQKEYTGDHAQIVGFTVFGNLKLRTSAGDRVNARPFQLIDASHCQCMAGE